MQGENGEPWELAEPFKWKLLASHIIWSLVRSQQSMWTRDIQLIFSTWVSKKYSTESISKIFWRNCIIREVFMWIDDAALKMGLCKMEQKYFSLEWVNMQSSTRIWIPQPVDCESKGSKMSQYKVSGWCSLMYIHLRCFKWEINNLFQWYRNSLEADLSLGNKILA